MIGRYDPIVLTAAVTGGDVLPSQSQYIPRGVEAIARECIAAATAGAACVHIHAREDDGRPTGSPQAFRRIAETIRAESDVVINFSTGGAPGMSVEERLGGVREARPDIATFNLGTMNYEGFPIRSRWPEVHTQWEREVLEEGGSRIFENTLATMRLFAEQIRDLGIVPELEAYDMGHLHMARFLIDEGTLEPPVRVQLVLGVLGAAGTSAEDLFTMKHAAERILGPDLASLGVASTGYPAQLRNAAIALALGLDCRVGLEDNIRITRGELARSNADLVRAAVDVANLLGRPMTTAQEFRTSLAALPWARLG